MSPGELDEEGSRRSTRGRNPLPPTSGPLFPPLPPKIPKLKNSPVIPDSSKSPSASRSSKAEKSGSSRSVPSPPFDARSSRSESSKHMLASGSGTSLTPPPPDQEEVESDDRLTPDEDEPQDPPDDGQWDNYRRRRTIRAFPSASKSGVKTEPEDAEEDDEETPKRTRSNGRRQVIPHSGENTPSAEAMGSGSEWSGKARKRRGEELLLLDDHLLPEEIRRTALAAVRRDKQSVSTSAKDEKQVEEGVEEDTEEVGEDEKLTEEEDAPKEEAEVAEEEEEEAVPEEEEDDDGGDDDVTRCVCFTMDSDEMMIQCDMCNVWQHGQCIGIWTDEEAPDGASAHPPLLMPEYFCERCKPELHQPLKKWMKNKRTPALYLPPTPNDLKRLHHASDKYPPSQSKRWSDTSLNVPLVFSPPPRHRKPPSPVRDLSRRGGSRSVTKANPPRSERHVSVAEPAKRQTSHRRKASIDAASPVRESRSPPRSGTEPKRRSTMNSRDAAYEEAVKRALEESRLEALGGDGEDEEGLEEAIVEDEVRPAERKGKGKRKRDDDDTGSVEPSGPQSHGGKPKHPNQYTYRPKPLSASLAPPAPSPARRGHQGGTPVPVAPPAQHEHGTRRAGALATSAVAQPFTTTTSIHNLHWHLPDHLSSYSDILPTTSPTALEVRSPRTMPYLPRNHFLNQRYGPISDARDEHGRLELPGDQPGREPIGDKTTHLEHPARVKYPQRRMTTADLRKRVRSVLEYVNKVQAEEGKRMERAKILGIEAKPLPLKEKKKRKVLQEAAEVEGGEEGKREENGEESQVDGGPNGHLAEDGDVEMADAEAVGSEPNGDPEHAEAKEAGAPGEDMAPTEEPQPEDAPAAHEEVEEEEEEEDDEAHLPRLTTRSGPTAAQLLEELSKDIIAFQETLFAGGFSTPIPSSSSTLPANGDQQPTSGLAKEVASALGDSESMADPDDASGSSSRVDAPAPAKGESPLAGLGIGLPESMDLAKGLEVPGDGAAETIVENMDEAVDVYREGKVGKVVTTTTN